MKITEELANEIMEGLFHLALSAYGNTESEWALNTAMIYALQTFEKLMDDWEKGLGMEWEIIKAEPTMWVMDKESHRCLTFPKENGTSIRHGRWLKNGDRYCECSECHHEGNISGQDNYCWYCGTKMDLTANPNEKSGRDTEE